MRGGSYAFAGWICHRLSEIGCREKEPSGTPPSPSWHASKPSVAPALDVHRRSLRAMVETRVRQLIVGTSVTAENFAGRAPSPRRGAAVAILVFGVPAMRRRSTVRTLRSPVSREGHGDEAAAGGEAKGCAAAWTNHCRRRGRSSSVSRQCEDSVTCCGATPTSRRRSDRRAARRTSWARQPGILILQTIQHLAARCPYGFRASNARMGKKGTIAGETRRESACATCRMCC